MEQGFIPDFLKIDINQFAFEQGGDNAVLRIEMLSENEDEINYTPTVIALLENPYNGNIFEISSLGITGSNIIFNVSNNSFSSQSGVLLFQSGDGDDLVTYSQGIGIAPLSMETMEFDLAMFGDKRQSNLKIFVTDSDDVVVSNMQSAVIEFQK